MTLHTCHAHECYRKVPPKLLMCPAHWGKLEKRAQAVIWGLYRPGQELDKQPSLQYVLAQRTAVALVAVREKHKDTALLLADVMRRVMRAGDEHLNECATILAAMGFNEMRLSKSEGDLALLREKRALFITEQRDAAVQRAQAFDLELRELTGGGPQVRPATSPQPVRPLTLRTQRPATQQPLPGAELAGRKGPEIVRVIVAHKEGAAFKDILSPLQRVKPEIKAKALYTMLHRLTQSDDSPLVKVGTQGSYQYYTRGNEP